MRFEGSTKFCSLPNSTCYFSGYVTFIAINNYNNTHKKYSKALFIAFTVLFGVFIIIPEGADGYRHAMNVNVHYLDLDFYSFFIETKNLLLFRTVYGANEELFLHVISYITSIFWRRVAFFFGIVSIVYAYFYFSGIIKFTSFFRKTSNFYNSIVRDAYIFEEP